MHLGTTLPNEIFVTEKLKIGCKRFACILGENSCQPISNLKKNYVCSIIYSIETRVQSQPLYFQILFRCNSVITIFKKNF